MPPIKKENRVSTYRKKWGYKIPKSIPSIKPVVQKSFKTFSKKSIIFLNKYSFGFPAQVEYGLDPYKWYMGRITFFNDMGGKVNRIILRLESDPKYFENITMIGKK